MRSLGPLAAALLVATGVHAQEVSEVQRCVWRCLANSAGASDPAYTACVENFCYAEDPAPLPAGRWSRGREDGGQAPFLPGEGAYVTAEDGEHELAYICGRAGEYVRIAGPAAVPTGLSDGQEIRMAFRVDGRDQAVVFHARAGAAVGGGRVFDPVLAALRRGRVAEVGIAGRLLRFPLRGSSAAIREVAERCPS